MKHLMYAAVLAILMATGVSRAAGTMGPPAPEYRDGKAYFPGDSAGTHLNTSSSDRLDAMNPLSILSGAGEVLTSRLSSTQGEGGAPSSRGDSGSQKPGLSTAVNILVVLTIISLAPSLMLMCTCFVRILIVLGFLRQALGTSSIPPPQVVTALSLFATLLVMTPTLQRINDEAIKPYQAGIIRDYDTMWNAAKQPVRDFMFDQIEASGNWSSVYSILDYRGIDTSEPENLTRADVDMVTLVPAFLMSELKVAFLMGFKVFLPFLVIDMVVSTMLISMGMMMLPPVLISMPFKILLFILVDGWALVIGSLMRSFRHAPAELALHLDQGLSGIVNLHALGSLLT
jgi:flagellar biosynthetic protein FliP